MDKNERRKQRKADNKELAERMYKENMDIPDIADAIGCTPANIYKYLADIPKRAVVPRPHLKYKKSIKKGDLCNCGNQAVDMLKGQLLCRKCMCPDYQHELKIYQDGNLALEINNRFYG